VADQDHLTDDLPVQTAEPDETTGGEEGLKMALSVEIDNVGPCKKHVRVTVPREGIDQVRQKAVAELLEGADVPGFRRGHAPVKLVERRFREQIDEQVKQKVLLHSLEQLAEEQDLDPINEPDIDLDDIDIPEEGNLEYEFDVEVRPEFELPEYKGLRISRPVREITEDDVVAYEQEFLEQYARHEATEEPARPGEFVHIRVRFRHGGEIVREFDGLTVRLRPLLRFQDTEVEGFDALMTGVRPGDVRTTRAVISLEAENIAMRGESVEIEFEVLDVKRMIMPDLDEKFLGRIGVQSSAQLRDEIRSMLERQVTYQQRQATRNQVMDRITESATWDLPEDLVRKQTENALRREVLEMRQAGFTPRQIQARENELRQRSVSTTRRNLKQHFILDRLAETENIEVTESDLDAEIMLMAIQAGENPRRVRARLKKTGLIENLMAQVRERKAVDVIIEHARFEDVPMDPPTDRDVEAVARAICSTADVEAESAAPDED
jgi:trigger factor